MKLFEEYPYLEDETLIIKRMTDEDADALGAFAASDEVYRYLPTFLYEQKYDDAAEVLKKMDAECFDTKESILMGIYYKPEESRFIGLAEIYNYEENKAKASIGCRIAKEWWGRGICTDVVKLLKEYLLSTDVRTITAHIMRENQASAGTTKKNGFLCKYPDTYGDWGFDDLIYADKYVFKKEWLDGKGVTTDESGNMKLQTVQVEQFVMAYEADQDRIRAILPDGYTSLRPVLRINTEIRDDGRVYIEFNTPVEALGRRGWLNIANWKSSRDDIECKRSTDHGRANVTIKTPFLRLSYKGTGIEGGCPAEKDNEGCFYIKDGPVKDTEFRPAETINSNKEFCDCEFAWTFNAGDARGKSEGKTIAVAAAPSKVQYQRLPLTAENAAAIPCSRVLGAYMVKFERHKEV